MLDQVKRDGGDKRVASAGDRLSLGQLMFLIAGAALGLGLLPVRSAAHFPVTGPYGLSLQGMVIAFYGTVSGITMAAFFLLVMGRLRDRRPWGPAAVTLFVTGLTAWVFLPMVVIGWIRNSARSNHLAFSCALTSRIVQKRTRSRRFITSGPRLASLSSSAVAA